MRNSAILQVALDFSELDRALKIAEEALEEGASWLEIGTPLIKSEGMRAIREFRRKFPDAILVADLKTVDTGALEVEMAAKSGADVVIILGLADNSTIKEAVKAGRRYGAKIMVDLLNVDNMIERAIVLEKLGIDYVCVHVGIDQQMRGLSPIDLLRKITKKVKIPVAVAGGINSESAAEAVKAGASIVIVGGAITKSENIRQATRDILKSIKEKIAISTELYKRYDEEEKILKILRRVSTPNLSDAMHRSGNMLGILPIVNGIKLVGRAVTVRTYPGDWSKPIQAIDLAEPGDVIVIDAGGSETAVWGELATWSCVKKGIAGVVIDGGIRDVDEIRALKFPAFARHICPKAGDAKGLGEINIPIKCGGVDVRPGDYIVGDDNGVIVIPKEDLVEVANRALDVLEKENRIREEIKEGSTLSRVLSLRKWDKVIG